MFAEFSLSAEVRQFIDSIGAYFTQYGLPGLAGRLLGLTLVADRPLSLDDMAGALGVSRASVSMNIRVLKSVGFVEQIKIPRDRRDYYRCSSDPWGATLRANVVATDALLDVARQGLLALKQSDGLARTHVEELIDFGQFYVHQEQRVLDRWREHRQQRLTSSDEGGDFEQ